MYVSTWEEVYLWTECMYLGTWEEFQWLASDWPSWTAWSACEWYWLGSEHEQNCDLQRWPERLCLGQR